MTTSLVQESNKKLWLAAIKPPMYTVAVIPIWLGTAVAWAETSTIKLGIFSTFLISAILIIAWLNLSNDVFDSDTGIDKNKAESLVNLTGNRNLIFWLSNLFLAGGILGIFAIAFWQQDWTVIQLVLLCCALGYSYQGPPFRFGYQGLGEIICFVTFGPMAVAASYYSQTQSWSLNYLATSVIVGITTSLILFCSHFHQVEDDIAAGKKSPIVRLGTKLGADVLTWVSVGIYVLIGLFVLLGIFPMGTLLTFLSLPYAIALVRYVRQYHDRPDKVRTCKFIAVKLHFLSGLLLGLGLVFGSW
ncbi:MAG TPA: 2-carboxy-1,4-naphthoquinone phytyltransferase [Cyanobacteria bacterium UBA11149]|nr:2-carboxy-1,4-naphthoquinone phytyltransferase [Cyanobacteria bacterium UBA11367]HBE57382.1 2-carboxy-1,4-naphthoquinone phytyltransferase [Cyanobacteria bacterium UBA11366]HBK66898.1 2-carboxy-1,4-naphthoquinone phytyltransferase [Cyanobacteria bacterium UBA11166]HBR73455.1 2-carboxy-1,4-naphthoquinone phytyltransferase [Cyanobacteria bacterium UBA11159]HBS69709.1 2-carboxy-1,4-naphthoquinone phytyltransferase [Cyanobacteria bacterium UBA11153]HBW88391.1 2-carboxy-1,4-naphthoquinone phytyl